MARRNACDNVRRPAGFGRWILDGGRFGFVRRGFRCFLRGIFDVSLVVIAQLHALSLGNPVFRRYCDVSAGLSYQTVCHASATRGNVGLYAKDQQSPGFLSGTSSSE